jgi:hypothetical protein
MTDMILLQNVWASEDDRQTLDSKTFGIRGWQTCTRWQTGEAVILNFAATAVTFPLLQQRLSFYKTGGIPCHTMTVV